jgi:hypothetical protein
MREQTLTVSSFFRLFFITKLHPSSFETLPGVILVDMSVADASATRWFELSTIFAANSQIETLVLAQLQTASSKAIEVCTILRKLADMSRTDWQQLFENPQKQIMLRSLVDGLSTDSTALLSAVRILGAVFAPDGEHPLALVKYNSVVACARTLVRELPGEWAVFQVLNAFRTFSAARERPSLAPMSMLHGFPELVFDAIQCLPSSERMQFQAQFEFTNLKPIVSPQYLLFEMHFPKIHERPLAPLMPQLISHVSTRYVQVPRNYFTFIIPEGLPLPLQRPVVVVLDRAIPTDMYARALSHFLPSKGYVLLSIGSFSNRGLTSAAVIRTIMEGCRAKSAFMLFLVDELLPPFTLPAAIHYSHVTAFVGYYVIVNEVMFRTIPIIPNAIVVKVAKPFSMAGASRLLGLFPTFRREAVRWEFPLIFLELLLAHRDDFPIKFHHILPSAAAAKDIWQNNAFENAQARELWLNIVFAMWRTMTDSALTHRALFAVLKHFFKDSLPAIPTVARIDFENDTLFASEFPPPPGECGLMVALKDSDLPPDERPTFGWRGIIQGRPMVIGEADSDFKIEKARLINGRYRDSEITIIGESEVTLSVGGPKRKPPIAALEIPVFDGRERVGSVYANCPGNRDLWVMSAVHILLPRPS